MSLLKTKRLSCRTNYDTLSLTSFNNYYVDLIAGGLFVTESLLSPVKSALFVAIKNV